MSYDHLTDFEIEALHQPVCCAGVVCRPRNLGGVTLTSVAEALCRCGNHRIRELQGDRLVFHINGGANPQWIGRA